MQKEAAIIFCCFFFNRTSFLHIMLLQHHQLIQLLADFNNDWIRIIGSCFTKGIESFLELVHQFANGLKILIHRDFFPLFQPLGTFVLFIGPFVDLHVFQNIHHLVPAEAFFFPWISIHMISIFLPEARSFQWQKLNSTEPFGTFPKIQMWNNCPQRIAVFG